MSVWKFSRSVLLLFFLSGSLFGCLSRIGQRQFAASPEPAPAQSEGMVVQDDGSIIFVKDRLEISLHLLGDDYLNRQFPSASNKGVRSTNPYTYGDWKPWGQEWTPQRFTVALVNVKNYAYPKIFIDPKNIYITTSNRRAYERLNKGLLEDHFSSYLRAYSGLQRRTYESISDLLTRTLYPADLVFSGQESSGYVVFPVLDGDVSEFTVHLPRVVLRFDYKSDPVETIDLAYKFHRDLYKGIHPREAQQ